MLLFYIPCYSLFVHENQMSASQTLAFLLHEYFVTRKLVLSHSLPDFIGRLLVIRA